MAGFGGAIKMLGIGFASGRGKAFVHSNETDYNKDLIIDWEHAKSPGMNSHWVLNWNPEVVSTGTLFRERFAEYALAAIQGKQMVYLTFALNIVPNCDCDGEPMQSVYNDLGILASTDPVAIDKAVFDLLTERQKEKPFDGDEIFPYAEKIGLGTTNYQLITL